MNEVDLAAVRARVDAATEGPWEVFASPQGWRDEEDLEVGPDCAPSVAVVGEGLGNAEFIAAARSDVPALLALVEQQQAVIEAVEKLATVPEHICGETCREWGCDNRGTMHVRSVESIRAALSGSAVKEQTR